MWRFHCFLVLISVTGKTLLFSQDTYTLKKSLQTARANNLALKAASANIGIAQADVITARLRPNPVLNNQSLQLTRPGNFAPNSGWNDGRNRQVWWQLTKPFRLPTARNSGIDLAQKQVAVSESVYSETERGLFQEVASRWVDVWASRIQFDLLQLARSNADSLASINQLRYRNKVITETDLARTELLAGQFAIQAQTARQHYQNQLLDLKRLLGVQGDIAIDTTDAFAILFPGSMDSLLRSALGTRPDVQATRYTIEAANVNMKLQKALAWPSPEFGVIYNPQNTIPYIGFYGTIQIPLFARNQGEIRKSSLLKAQSEQNLAASQLQVQTELTTAFQSYQTQRVNLEHFEPLLRQSEKILGSVKYAYLRGGTNMIDYLEAQRSWLDTQQNYYETLRAYRQSCVDLLYASGMILYLAP